MVLQYAVGKPKTVAEPDRVEVDAWEVTGESWVDAKECSEMLGKVPVGLAIVMVDAVSDVKVREMGAALTDPAAAVSFFQQNVDEDDAPLTEEDIAEARREWVEANERVAAQMRAEADRPSFAATNGDCGGERRPSFTATNGDRGAVDRPSVAGANGVCRGTVGPTREQRVA